MKKLPTEVQFSPIYAFASMDVDKDGDSDVVMGGNESKVRVRLGKSDANRGLVLLMMVQVIFHTYLNRARD